MKKIILFFFFCFGKKNKERGATKAACQLEVSALEMKYLIQRLVSPKNRHGPHLTFSGTHIGQPTTAVVKIPSPGPRSASFLIHKSSSLLGAKLSQAQALESHVPLLLLLLLRRPPPPTVHLFRRRPSAGALP